jgi:hypothetical protein
MDTGIDWNVERDAGVPSTLIARGVPAPVAGRSDLVAIAFLQRYADVLGVGDLANELALVGYSKPTLPGDHHVLQFAQQIPGSDIRTTRPATIVIVDRCGGVRRVVLYLVKGIAKLSTRPAKTAEQARIVAMAGARTWEPRAAGVVADPPELVVHGTAGGRGALAWRVKVHLWNNFGSATVVVDATSGRIVEKTMHNGMIYN